MQLKCNKAALQNIWEHLRCLILEEVSMMSPQLYNMVAYRAFLGRREAWEVDECDYDKQHAAFGRMPIVIHLGDFLQLKPIGCSISLIKVLTTVATWSCWP